jgi:hypothetical protein
LGAFFLCEFRLAIPDKHDENVTDFRVRPGYL